MHDQLLRLQQIIGNSKKGILPIIPVSRSTWYRGVETGKFPQPVKFADGRATFWKASEIYSLID